MKKLIFILAVVVLCSCQVTFNDDSPPVVTRISPSNDNEYKYFVVASYKHVTLNIHTNTKYEVGDVIQFTVKNNIYGE